jgi:predicted nucleotidyltransferase
MRVAEARHNLLVTIEVVDKLRAASLITEFLAARSNAVEAVCVYGSVARGNATVDSDIDLLVVGDGAELSSRLVRTLAPTELRHLRPVLTFYTMDELEVLLSSRVSFAAHLATEGRILFDRYGALKRMFAAHSAKPLAVEEELEYQLRRLRSFEDTSQFNGNFMFCLAQLYVVGKAVIMLILAGEDRPEYDKDRAFKVMARTRPELRADLERVAELKPFYLQVTRRVEAAFPFSYRDADDRVTGIISAIRRIAKAR